MRLLIATSNPGKLREVQAILQGLPIEFLTLRDFVNVPVAIEDGETFDENARRKATHYALHTGEWTLADDSGLEVDALNGAPGVYSARYAGPDASDADNNAKLIRNLAGVPAERRTARFRCLVALACPLHPASKTQAKSHAASATAAAGAGDATDTRECEIVATAAGTFEGVIIDKSRGHNGFGYDPHFLVPDRGLTSAELPPEQKNALSHRGQALRTIRPAIKRLQANLD